MRPKLVDSLLIKPSLVVHGCLAALRDRCIGISRARALAYPHPARLCYILHNIIYVKAWLHKSYWVPCRGCNATPRYAHLAAPSVGPEQPQLDYAIGQHASTHGGPYNGLHPKSGSRRVA